MLVGASVLVTAALGMTSVAASTAQMRRLNEERAAATRALDREAARLEAGPYDDLMDQHDGRGFGVDADGVWPESLRAIPDDEDGLPGSIAVSVPDEPGDANRLLDVTVRIDWVAGFSPQNVSRTLRISRLGAGE